MRATLGREYSDRDYARAQILAEALWEYRDGLGNGQMARLLGFDWRTQRDKANSTSRIYDLMPLVQRIVAAQHEGHMVERPGGGLARIGNAPDNAARQAIPRLGKVYSALQRANSELDVIRRNSIDPVQQNLAAGVGVMMHVFEAQVGIAIAKEAQRLNDEVEIA